MNELIRHFVEEFGLPLHNPVLIFSLILLIILLSPLLLRKLKIPSLIGLIISGVLIGPHGLHLLDNDAAIRLFSTIGLLYLMFIAGLELDLQSFSVNRNKSLLFGLFTFAIPLCLGFPVCSSLLHYNVEANLFISCMFATHTLVSYPIVSKMGVYGNKAVATAVGGTILTDTLVLLLFAVIMGNHLGHLTGMFWLRMGVGVVVLIGMLFFVIPRIARWLFSKLESEKQSHYIFVLAVLFFAAFFSQVAGLEPIIGAFLSGIALNKLIPRSSVLMNRIEFIGNSLFIPFFLISVGMMVNVSVLFSNSVTWILTLVLTCMALAGKWIAAFVTQLICRFSANQRKLLFGLSSSRAAATLAMISTGYMAGLIDENVLNATILLILITCIVSSFVTENAARGLILSGEQDRTKDEGVRNTEHLLLPMVDNADMEKVLDLSLLMSDNQKGSQVSLLSVLPEDNASEEHIRAVQKQMSLYKAHLEDGKLVNTLVIIDYNPLSGIVRMSRESMSDMVVLPWLPKEQGGIIAESSSRAKSFFKTQTGLRDILQSENSLFSIVDSIEKTVLLVSIKKNLVENKRMVLLVPPLAEFENGFEMWVAKVMLLAQELSLPIVLYATESTYEKLMGVLNRQKLTIKITFVRFYKWHSIAVLRNEIHERDLLICVLAKTGSISHRLSYNTIPAELEKSFVENNKIMIFPQQFDRLQTTDTYKDMSSELITRGINTFDKIQKGITSVFKNEDKNEKEC